MTYRERSRKASNNPHNPNKNICGLRVAQYLGVGEEGRYLHNTNDLVYNARKKHTVRSRTSQVKGKTVGATRAKLAKLATEVEGCKGFIVRVPGHVMFADVNGQTIVDTAPRKRDKRRITDCYIVY